MRFVKERVSYSDQILIWAAQRLSRGMHSNDLGTDTRSQLIERGWIDASGALTEAGKQAAGGTL